MINPQKPVREADQESCSAAPIKSRSASPKIQCQTLVLAATFHTWATRSSHVCDLAFTLLSQFCHISVTVVSHFYHSFVTLPSHICHTLDCAFTLPSQLHHT
jgi:hypothetical protein